MTLGWGQILQLSAVSLLLASGQLLFKRGADLAAQGGGGLFASLLMPAILLAVAVYAGTTVLWIHLLRSTPLSLAYPFTALGFVLVPLGAHFFFAEPLGWRYLVGIALIVAGLYFTMNGR